MGGEVLQEGGIVKLEPGKSVLPSPLSTLARPAGQEDLLGRGAGQVEKLEGCRGDWRNFVPSDNPIRRDLSLITEASISRIPLVLKGEDLQG
jgi:hypothetical protein